MTSPLYTIVSDQYTRPLIQATANLRYAAEQAGILSATDSGRVRVVECDSEGTPIEAEDGGYVGARLSTIHA